MTRRHRRIIMDLILSAAAFVLCCLIVLLSSLMPKATLVESLLAGCFIFGIAFITLMMDIYDTPIHFRVRERAFGSQKKYIVEQQNVLGKWFPESDNYFNQRGYAARQEADESMMRSYRYWDTMVNWFGDPLPSTLSKNDNHGNKD